MTNNKEQKNTLIDLIEKSLCEVEPKNSWYFALHNFLFWTFGIVAVIFGAAAFAVIIFTVKHSGHDLSIITYGSNTGHFIHVLPYLWLVSLGIFWLSAQKLIRLTDCGYRFDIKKIFLTLIGASLFLGFLLDIARTGEYLDRRAGEMIPFHRPIRVIHQSDWSAVQEGRLGGTLVGNRIDQQVSLRGFNQETWKLDLSGYENIQDVYFEDGDMVRVIGVLQEGGVFYVCGMHAWIFEKKKAQDTGQVSEDVSQRPHRERKIIEVRSKECKGLQEKYNPLYRSENPVPERGY